MLPRIHRASKISIEKTIRSGKTILGDFVYAKVLQNEENKPCFAVVVAKKVEKTSVGRHRIKRMINGCIEDVFLKTKTNFSGTVVFFVKKTEKKASGALFKFDIEKIAKQIY